MLFHPPRQPAEIRVRHLNQQLAVQQQQMAEVMFDKRQQRELQKRNEREKKQRVKDDKRIYVLDFKGDVQASAVEHLREEITLILSMARAGRDRVVLRLDSPGGMVHGYG